MRVLIILSIFVFAQSALGTQKGFRLNEVLENPTPDAVRLFEDKINSTLECVKNLLNNGDESIGLPSFNPLKLNGVTFDLDKYGSELISGKVTLDNFAATGIASWLTSHIKVKVTIIPIGAKVELSMAWPGGNVVGDYSGEVNVLGHNLKGKGHFVGSLLNLAIDINLQATLTKIGLRNFSIKPSLENVTLKIDGLLVDGEDKSEHISEIFSNGAEWVAEHQDEIDAILSNIIMGIINKNAYSERGLIADVINKCL